jgi:hypothetical protein
MTMLSVFMVPLPKPETRLAGTPVAFRGHECLTAELKGHHTVYWTENRSLFGLVSMLGYDTLLDGADRLRADHATRTDMRERRAAGRAPASRP